MSEGFLAPFQGAFTGVVNAISGVAKDNGGAVAGTLNSATGVIPAEAMVGSTIIIMILGIVAWKLITSTPLKYGALIVIGAVLFKLWGVA